MRLHKRQRIALLFTTLVFTASTPALIPTTVRAFPLFTVFICAADGNPIRVATAGMIRESFRRMHIDAQISYQPWSVWRDRVFYPNSSQLGAIYDEGGWDIFIVGFNLDKYRLDPSFIYDSQLIPRFNFMLFDDYENDAMLDNIRLTYNDTQRWELMKDWQTHIHDASPIAILYYPNTTFAYDPGWTGLEDISYIFPAFGDPIVRHQLESEWIVGRYYDPDDFLPTFSNSDYDRISFSGIYESLFRYVNNQDFFNFNQTPALAAASWDVSDDGLNWTLDLRSDVYWPTGHQFNASDVYLTYIANVIPTLQSARYDSYLSAGLNNESFEILSRHRIRVQFNETIGPYAWARSLLNIEPLPHFVLSNVSWENWRNHPINTGTTWVTTDVNGQPYTCYGPMGLGPYVCSNSTSGWNEGSRSFKAYLRGSDNDVGLANGTKLSYFMGNNGFGSSPLPTVFGSIFGSGYSVVDYLRNGTIDLIDPEILSTYHGLFFSLPWGATISSTKPGFQSIGFNFKHPVFGTGIATPNGQREPANASLYAKYVRQALNYLIPRQAIIDQLLDGKAVLGMECIPPFSNSFNSMLEPYTYRPEKARQLLEKAGYVIPTIPYVNPLGVLITLMGIIVVISVITVTVFLLYQRRTRQTRKSK